MSIHYEGGYGGKPSPHHNHDQSTSPPNFNPLPKREAGAYTPKEGNMAPPPGTLFASTSIVGQLIHRDPFNAWPWRKGL